MVEKEVAMLRFEGVWKVYRMGRVDVVALRDVSLEVEEGEFVVVLGPSGSGKTTMLNIAGGIDRPTRGRVFFKELEISSLDEKGLTDFRRNHVGFVFQFFNLVPTLTAKENVQLAAELVDDPMDVDEVLEMVGLKHRANHFPFEMSGGEQQRVAIARALVKRPDIILGDEPTGNLDFETGKKVLKVMKEINEEMGTTFLIVTHNTAISNIADKIIHFRDGRVFGVEVNPNPVDPEELSW